MEKINPTTLSQLCDEIGKFIEKPQQKRERMKRITPLSGQLCKPAVPSERSRRGASLVSSVPEPVEAEAVVAAIIPLEEVS